MTYGMIYNGHKKAALSVAYAAKPKPKVKGKKRGRPPYVWTIEGEALTLAQIAARCPGIAAATVKYRLAHGKRTWATLQLSVAEGKRANGRNMAARIRRSSHAAGVAAEERRAYLAQLHAGHADLNKDKL